MLTIPDFTPYGIKCCMHAHLEAPRAPPSRGELCRCKTLFVDNFPNFFLSQMGPGHPLPNYFWIFGIFFFNFAKPLSMHMRRPTRANDNQYRIMGYENVIGAYQCWKQALIKSGAGRFTTAKVHNSFKRCLFVKPIDDRIVLIKTQTLTEAIYHHATGRADGDTVSPLGRHESSKRFSKAVVS